MADAVFTTIYSDHDFPVVPTPKLNMSRFPCLNKKNTEKGMSFAAQSMDHMELK